MVTCCMPLEKWSLIEGVGFVLVRISRYAYGKLVVSLIICNQFTGGA